MNLTGWLAIAVGILVLALGGAGYLLKTSYEDNGKLKASNDQLQATVRAKTQATQGRAQTDDSVRKLAPADVLQRLK